MDENEINLYDYWVIIRKNLRFIICLVILSVFLSLIVSLLIPKTYRATASILPPQSGGGEITGIEGLLAAGINLSQKATTSNILTAILKSKTMADEINKKFNFSQTHKRKPNKMDVNVSKEGVINVSVIDINPQVAADMANFYISTLDRLNQTLNITTAGEKRRFIEKRLEETREDLKKAEERLKNYQVSHKILAASETEQSGKTAGELQGNLLAARMELEVKKKYATSQNPEIINLQNRVTEMEKVITGLPPLETELARLIRDLKVQGTVYSLLISQYEQTKIEEARDTPTIQILDRASVPERVYKPNIRQNVAISGIIALFLGIILSLLKESAPKQKIKE